MTSDRLETIVSSLFLPGGSNGVHARSAEFERVVDGLSALISRYRVTGTEVLSFPPVMSAYELKRSGYLNSFPHLLGCVSCLHGGEAEIRAALEHPHPDGDWTTRLKPTDLVLTPAACYPVYPLAAKSGRVPEGGRIYDVSSYCFRHEASFEADRLQSFRMREYVCIGNTEQAQRFRAGWMSQARELADSLGLPHRIAPASDPFFGRAGKLMAMSQEEQNLKFELLIPVRSEEQPTACMSFNCHLDHFSANWDITTETGDIAHTACVAFGMDRLGLALFATHGGAVESWPEHVRHALSI